MANRYKIKFEQLSSHQALLLTRVLSETRGLLKSLTGRMANSLAQAKALREGTAIDVDRQTREIIESVAEVRTRLEHASWKFIGMDLPLEDGTSIGLIEALFEDEEKFEQLVRAKQETFGIDENWMKELKDLVIRGHRNVTPLFAQLSYATKSGLLISVEGQAGSVPKDLAELPSARSLAGNPKGPHPLSDPNGNGPAERKSFEDQAGSARRLVRRIDPELPKTIIYDVEEDHPGNEPQHDRQTMPIEVTAATQSQESSSRKTTAYVPPPPPDPFGAKQVSRRTSGKTKSESTTQMRRRKRFE